MNLFIIFELLLVVLIAVVSLPRNRAKPNFARIQMGLCFVLLAACVVQWLREGVSAWVLAIAALSLVCFAFGFLRSKRIA